MILAESACSKALQSRLLSTDTRFRGRSLSASRRTIATHQTVSMAAKTGAIMAGRKDHLCGYAMDFGGIMPALDSGFGCPAATLVALRQPRLCLRGYRCSYDLRSANCSQGKSRPFSPAPRCRACWPLAESQWILFVTSWLRLFPRADHPRRKRPRRARATVWLLPATGPLQGPLPAIDYWQRGPNWPRHNGPISRRH